MKNYLLKFAFCLILITPIEKSEAQFCEFGGGYIYQRYRDPANKDFDFDGVRNLTNSHNFDFNFRLNDWRLVDKGISAGLRFSFHNTNFYYSYGRHGYGGTKDLMIRNIVLDLDILPWKFSALKDHINLRAGFHTQLLLNTQATGYTSKSNYIHRKFDTSVYDKDGYVSDQLAVNPGFTVLLSGKIISRKTWYIGVSTKLDWSPFPPFGDRRYLTRFSGTIQYAFLFRDEQKTKEIRARRRAWLEDKSQRKTNRLNKRISRYQA